MNDRGAVRLGLVHTVPALGAVFEDLVVRAWGDNSDAIELVHVTDPWLLATAVTDGVTPGVTARLAAHVDHLVRFEVSGVLVTCSSLGEATEQVAAGTETPVVRVDQRLADRAVDIAGLGGRIAVLATVGSTVGPTARLLERSAGATGTGVTVDVDVLDDAGRARAAGDDDTHDRLVAAAVDRVTADGAGVVVLAQASMARAVDLDVDRDVPVLASPELAANALVDVVRGRT